MTQLKSTRAGGVEVTRRTLLQGAGALTFVIGAQGIANVYASDANAAADPLAENIWAELRHDGTVTIIFPLTEMGQGSSTALPIIFAEEMDADWDRVQIQQLNRDDRAYGNPKFGNLLYTAGSSAVMGYFDPLRKAGAQARLMLMQIAADHWSMPRTALTTEPGFVVDKEGGRRLSYGEIAKLHDGQTKVPEVSESDFKRREAYRLIGQDVPRRDIAPKSTGTERYVSDIQLPNMLYAAVLRAPVEGEKPEQIDDSAAMSVTGVVRTVTLPDGVAVLAERLEAAFQGRDQLQVTWSESAPARAYNSEDDLKAYRQAAQDHARKGAVWSERGDAQGSIEGAHRVVEHDYLSDYAYHAQLEPMAAAASVDEDGKGADVWAATQTQTLTMNTITQVLDTTPDRIRLNMITMGGSFGRRTALMQEYVRDALLASKEAGRPVKVIWTREDDVKFGWFRPIAAQRMRAGLTEDGSLTGWHHRIATPSVIAYFNPVRWSQVEPQDIISVRGSENKFYDIENLLAEHVIMEPRARLAPWRAIGASYTGFAAEAFMDELAEAAGKDPLEFRLALLANNPRGEQLIRRVAEMSEWDRKRENTALGIAFAGYGDTMAAGVAEIALNREDGTISVPHIWAAVDAGLVISPRNAIAQVEGGIVYGLSSALKEQITIREGQVEQSNFYDYQILRANEVPEIAVHLETVDAPPTGIGEVGTPMVPAAIANAFFALTGKRLRHMPFTPERVQAALSDDATTDS